MCVYVPVNNYFRQQSSQQPCQQQQPHKHYAKSFKTSLLEHPTNSTITMSPHTGVQHQQQSQQPQQQQPQQQPPQAATQTNIAPQHNASAAQPALLPTQQQQQAPPQQQHSQHNALSPQPIYAAAPPPQQAYAQHGGGGGVYQMMSSSGVPGGVFVSNVPANVNLHGYIPHNAPMQHNMSAFAPVFVPAEMQQQHQQQQAAGSSSAGSEQVIYLEMLDNDICYFA